MVQHFLMHAFCRDSKKNKTSFIRLSHGTKLRNQVAQVKSIESLTTATDFSNQNLQCRHQQKSNSDPLDDFFFISRWYIFLLLGHGHFAFCNNNPVFVRCVWKIPGNFCH
ncbi:hypothetical protein CEXT_77711 [Caerostris extrusa]|uniref:Uncharacterized protein n=1 Tax=Caerostris extrusa TaxID=172846 RepID=A0AAV4U5J6_CAEEX|nr:hypothetical protein CEXT_77711 [Caerostris extrusa]